MEALPQGQYVRHYRYGFGLVTASNQEITSIDFESHGSKNFVTSLMDVEVSDLTPPKHLRAKWVRTAPRPHFVDKNRAGKRRRIADATQ